MSLLWVQVDKGVERLIGALEATCTQPLVHLEPVWVQGETLCTLLRLYPRFCNDASYP